VTEIKPVVVMLPPMILPVAVNMLPLITLAPVMLPPEPDPATMLPPVILPVAVIEPAVDTLPAITLPVTVASPAVTRLPPLMFPATVNKLVAISKVNAPVAPATPALLNMT
jgi:hypothetical protein